MTPVEMETLLHDIDLRLTRVELALPAMAADLRGEIADSARVLRQEIAEMATTLRTEMSENTRTLIARIDEMLTERIDRVFTERLDGVLTERIDRVLTGRIDGMFTERLAQTDRGLRVLIEDLRSDNQVLAEHILTLLSRFPPQ